MEIVLAESLGFCMGVKRAVDMAYRAIEKADGQQVVTLGPLIHNAQEIERLEKDGVKVADEDAIPDDSTVIIRAHGVTPEAMRSLKSRGVKVMDGTCPYVHYSQRQAVDQSEKVSGHNRSAAREDARFEGLRNHLRRDGGEPAGDPRSFGRGRDTLRHRRAAQRQQQQTGRNGAREL